MRPITKVKAIYLYPRLMDFRESIEGRADLVELDIKVSVFGRKRLLITPCGVGR